MCRVYRRALLVAVLAAGPANASSILVLEETDAEPGASAAAPGAAEEYEAQGHILISPSIIAIGEPPVTDEKTASTGRSSDTPEVKLDLRGGLAGKKDSGS